MKIYIASSWKNQHAVEMLTALLRSNNHEVVSWVENNFGESHNHVSKKFDFETWVNSEASDQSFFFDVNGAMTCDLFIYLGPAGKDAAAECGLCYGQRLAGKTIPMLALYAKGEDFGLMRKMFESWHDRYRDLIDEVERHARQRQAVNQEMAGTPISEPNAFDQALYKLDAVYEESKNMVFQLGAEKPEGGVLLNNLKSLRDLAVDGIKN